MNARAASASTSTTQHGRTPSDDWCASGILALQITKASTRCVSERLRGLKNGNTQALLAGGLNVRGADILRKYDNLVDHRSTGGLGSAEVLHETQCI